MPCRTGEAMPGSAGCVAWQCCIIVEQQKIAHTAVLWHFSENAARMAMAECRDACAQLHNDLPIRALHHQLTIRNLVLATERHDGCELSALVGIKLDATSFLVAYVRCKISTNRLGVRRRALVTEMPQAKECRVSDQLTQLSRVYVNAARRRTHAVCRPPCDSPAFCRGEQRLSNKTSREWGVGKHSESEHGEHHRAAPSSSCYHCRPVHPSVEEFVSVASAARFDG